MDPRGPPDEGDEAPETLTPESPTPEVVPDGGSNACGEVIQGAFEQAEQSTSVELSTGNFTVVELEETKRIAKEVIEKIIATNSRSIFDEPPSPKRPRMCYQSTESDGPQREETPIQPPPEDDVIFIGEFPAENPEVLGVPEMEQIPEGEEPETEAIESGVAVQDEDENPNSNKPPQEKPSEPTDAPEESAQEEFEKASVSPKSLYDFQEDVQQTGTSYKDPSSLEKKDVEHKVEEKEESGTEATQLSSQPEASPRKRKTFEETETGKGESHKRRRQSENVETAKEESVPAGPDPAEDPGERAEEASKEKGGEEGSGGDEEYGGLRLRKRPPTPKPEGSPPPQGSRRSPRTPKFPGRLIYYRKDQF